MKMRTRYQDSNWIVKLWRLRHYVYIPFRFIWWRIFHHNSSLYFPNSKTYWKILIGSAQCDMNWTYTSEEVNEYINKNKDE